MSRRLSDIVRTSDVMEAAFNHPHLQITKKTRKMPTIDDATKAVINAIEDACILNMAAEIRPTVEEEYGMHLLTYGDLADYEDKDAWTDAEDDMAEKICKPYREFLSADWLARHTIDSRIHEADDKDPAKGITSFCNSFGQEYYANITHDNEERKAKSPAKIMSSAGITMIQVQAALEAHIKANAAPQEETMAAKQTTETTDIDGVIGKIAAFVGKDHDQLSVYGDLDLATDNDELLANGAAPRLGITEDDLGVLQMERLEHGDETAQVLHDKINAALKKPAKPGAKPKAEKPAKPAKGAAKPAAEAEKAEDGEVSIIVLNHLKDCGASDGDMAQAIGVSRPTYNNYANGKTTFKPDENQKVALRDAIVERYNKMAEALGVIDGCEYDPVI